MNIQLAIDRGNSLTKLSVFDGQSIIAFESCTEDSLLSCMQALIRTHNPTCAIISDVRGDDFLSIHQDMLPSTIIRMHHSLKFPFSIEYETPETLGHDRLANMAGATVFKTESNMLVIDCGSCITYSLLHKGSFLGGSIAPGIRMRYRALHEYTGKLPSIEPSLLLPSLVGNSSIGSMQSGVEFAILLETDSMINAYSERFENLQILLTGGNYSFFENSLKSTIFAVPQLTQLGLHEILRLNLD